MLKQRRPNSCFTFLLSFPQEMIRLSKTNMES